MIPRKIHYCWFGRGEKPGTEMYCQLEKILPGL